MPTMLQSRPRSTTAPPPPPPPRRARLVIVGAVAVALIAGGIALTQGDDPQLTSPLAAEQPEAEQPKAAHGPAALAAPGVGSGSDAGSAEAGTSAGGSTLTAQERKQLPPEIRKRLRQEQGRRVHDPSRRPKQQAQPAGQPLPQVDRDERRGAPAERGPNRIEVRDQRTDGAHITIGTVQNDLPGAFVVVQEATRNGPGRVLGVKEVRSGTIDRLRMKLDQSISGQMEVFVSLYQDDLEPGVYVHGADRLVFGSAGPIAMHITVTAP